MMNKILSCFLLVGGLAALFLLAPQADALADPLAYVRTYTFSCTTGAARIVPSSNIRTQRAMRVWNSSATPIYLGGSDVNTSTTGWPICTDTALCEQASFPVDSQAVVYCVAGSTVSLKVVTAF
jgi:hypothetical protein